jgi:hypothetical protein
MNRQWIHKARNQAETSEGFGGAGMGIARSGCELRDVLIEVRLTSFGGSRLHRYWILITTLISVQLFV